MPSPLPEMDASRIAARERRLSLLAGAALTVVALGVLVFAIVAWTRAPAPSKAVAEPIVAAAPQTPAAADQAGSGGAAQRSGSRGGRAADAQQSSRSRSGDRIPMTAASASLFMPLYRRASQTR